MPLYSQIIATGSALPSRVVPNKELEPLLETTDDWIFSKIGIRERRYVSPGVGTSDLALEASLNALKKAGINKNKIDGIILATSTPDYCAPGSGVLLQQKLGLKNIPAFDVRNTSPGFLFALDLADGLIRSKKYKCLLVVASEVHSTALDMTPRGRLMSVIFGDGAGAVIMTPTTKKKGVLGMKLFSDGSFYDKLWCEAPASLYQPRITPQMITDGKVYPTMDGRLVFENAVKCMSEASVSILKNLKLKKAKIDFVLPHQANINIINTIGQKLKISPEKILTNIHKCGNTSAASIPILLDEFVSNGTIKRGNKLLVMSFGSGFSWGAGVISY
ncbi:ketoacyl-ACP synthase III [bacterium]|nr:ketoacyl-ACP synthase III [bacterium]